MNHGHSLNPSAPPEAPVLGCGGSEQELVPGLASGLRGERRKGLGFGQAADGNCFSKYKKLLTLSLAQEVLLNAC